MDRTIQIDTFTRFTRVSRETIISLEKYEEFLIKANNNLNLIGNSTLNQIWHRHFLDSFQAIDFISNNEKTLVLLAFRSENLLFLEAFSWFLFLQD